MTLTPLLILHKTRRQPYRHLNGPLGAIITARCGATAWDCDINVTADGRQVTSHWLLPMLRDGFTDPDRRMRRRTPITKMDAATVRRLRADKGTTSILEATTQISVAAKTGVTPCFEVKSWSRDGLFRMAQAADYAKVPLVLMATPEHVDALKFAHKVLGATTILLARGTVPPEWASFLSFVKGSRRSVRLLRRDFPRIGLGPKDATVHGCGVTQANVRAAKAAVHRAGGWA